ncbi:MAG: alpha/beta fold hydrolase [Deltaproteobacteria bacterium]|nr:alpha/beta fold hydrolase [Deltaproteobacteria bacterium]MBW2503152.1 alpha/beta fold hydrolase [Deltaproteobacteria bacterium]
MRVWLINITVCLFLGLSTVALAADKPYFYPYVNPYEATVMELPPYYHAAIPETVPTKTFKLKVFPERIIPEVFWYENGLDCSLVFQKGKAPLVFVIAGTGARHNSPKMLNLQKALYQAGYHVLSITSPTHMHFIVNASSTFTPGHLYEDAKDIYRVMQMAIDEVKNDIEISGYHLTGYSLGGIQSAFVAMLDEEKKFFDFKRVLLINPPVNLYNSVTRLDRLLVENIPGGINNLDSWLDTVMRKLAEAEKEMGYFELSGEYIYKAYKRFPPREDFLASLIGVSFRTDSSNMIFAADVMKGGGYITPKNAGMSNSTALTPFYLVASRTSFDDYFRNHFVPFYKNRDPSLTEEGLIEMLSLHQIEPYLRSARKIGLLHNEDDVILQPGEIDYLQDVFGGRAKVFPTGGHCGNMNHQDVVEFIVKFFAGQEG